MYLNIPTKSYSLQFLYVIIKSFRYYTKIWQQFHAVIFSLKFTEQCLHLEILIAFQLLTYLIENKLTTELTQLIGNRKLSGGAYLHKKTNMENMIRGMDSRLQTGCLDDLHFA